MTAKLEQTTVSVLYCLCPKRKGHKLEQIRPKILDINAISPKTDDFLQCMILIASIKGKIPVHILPIITGT